MRAILTATITAAVTFAGGLGLITGSHVTLTQRQTRPAGHFRAARVNRPPATPWIQTETEWLDLVLGLPGGDVVPATTKEPFLMSLVPQIRHTGTNAVPHRPPQYPWLASPPPEADWLPRHRPPHTWISPSPEVAS